jgi:hypothetical protein
VACHALATDSGPPRVCILVGPLAEQPDARPSLPNASLPPWVVLFGAFTVYSFGAVPPDEDDGDDDLTE